MDHGTMSMAMPMPTASTAPMSHAGDGSCKLEMLWNWHTVDACFLASTWRITSAGMFAGSCIGVVALVVFLEFLRRVSREYDRRVFEESRSLLNIAGTVSSSVSSREDGLITAMSDEKGGDKQQVAALHLTETSKGPVNGKFVRPSLVQQSVRALLYTAQLSLAYILMLLAMSFNGYILVCIFVGGFLGFLVFNWEVRTITASHGPSCGAAHV